MGAGGAAGRHPEAPARDAGASARADRRRTPFDPADLGLARHTVSLGDDLVIFAFEGEDIEQRVASLINDRVSSASFGAWMLLFAPSPALAQEVYYSEAGG
jgi:hypothetical protein